MTRGSDHTSGNGPAAPPGAPVLVGIGVATQRPTDWADGQSALGLMCQAARTAVRDTTAPAIGRSVEWVGVPHGRWQCDDPGALIAAAVGARACTALSEIGVLQQTLISELCGLVARGEIRAGLVAGGEIGHRLGLAARADARIDEPVGGRQPDRVMRPDRELRHPAERAAGLDRAVGYYAILESAMRHRRGVGVDAARTAIADTYSRFSAIAADNPHAWRRVASEPREIREPTETNPMMAFPYTRAMATSWSVDQAAALLVCTVKVAREHGIAEHRWIHPWVSAESNFMQAVCERADLAASPGTGAVSDAVLGHAGLAGKDFELTDLYSCFPSAVSAFAHHLGLPAGSDCTVTGGMPSAGGPYNNYLLQSTARLAELLRTREGRSPGVTSCVSGLLTKQAAAVWGRHAPDAAFEALDVSAKAAADAGTRVVLSDHAGTGTVAGYTVVDGPGRPRAIAIVDVGDRERTVVYTEDAAIVASCQTDEWCGRVVRVQGGQLVGSA